MILVNYVEGCMSCGKSEKRSRIISFPHATGRKSSNICMHLITCKHSDQQLIYSGQESCLLVFQVPCLYQLKQAMLRYKFEIFEKTKKSFLLKQLHKVTNFCMLLIQKLYFRLQSQRLGRKATTHVEYTNCISFSVKCSLSTN